MKIRNGFVSNSSSSSFVIRLVGRSFNKNNQILITEEEKQKLFEYGFKHTNYRYATNLEHLSCYDPESFTDEETDCLGCRVTCNEDEVIEFLVKNKIPFHAACHYGNVSVFFGRDSDEILFIQNYGQKFEMYFWDDDKCRTGTHKDMFDRNIEVAKPVSIITVEEYLSESIQIGDEDEN